MSVSILGHGSVSQKNWAKLVGLALAVLIVAAFILGAAFSPPAQAAGSEESQFLQLINQYRVDNGLQPLLFSPMITEACYRHNSDMGKYAFFDHYTVQSDWFASGASPWDRMAASGYSYNTYKGENIAAGYSTAAGVFIGWKNSPGHNANMLNANFKVIGISLVYVAGSPYGYYWTTDFGGYIDPTVQSPPASTTTTTAAPTTTTTAAPTTTTAAPTTTTTVQSAPPPVTTTTVRPTTTTTAAPAPTTTTTQRTTTTTVPAPPVTFTDVDPASPYAADIATLYEQGVVSGFGDGSFGPDRPVTRQQFAKMIVLALGYEVLPMTPCGFRDVDDQLDPNDPRYPAAYIAACADAGITLGKTADTFGPYEFISRAQLATMVARAAAVPACPPGYETLFARFDTTHYPWAARADAAGLLEGLPGMGASYDFWENATRAEVCVLLANLMER